MALVEVLLPAYDRLLDEPIGVQYLADWKLLPPSSVSVAPSGSDYWAGLIPRSCFHGFVPTEPSDEWYCTDRLRRISFGTRSGAVRGLYRSGCCRDRDFSANNSCASSTSDSTGSRPCNQWDEQHCACRQGGIDDA